MTRGAVAARPPFEAALADLALYGHAYDLLLAELRAELAAHDPHATETVAALRGLNARMRQRADLLEQLQIGRAPEAQVAGGAVRRIR
jgi:hypothetical protein